MGFKETTRICFPFLFVALQYGSLGAYAQGKPDHHDGAATARWLLSQNNWGVLSTVSIELGGAPFGNVESFSDGLPDNGTGIPYFYLTTLDPTPRNAMKDARASLTISEIPIGSCGKTDPENPTCAKLTLSGKLKLVNSNTDEEIFAEAAFYSKHSEMKFWPKGHNFRFYKLDIEDIFLIDWFGGAVPITLAEYLRPRMNRGTEGASSQ